MKGQEINLPTPQVPICDFCSAPHVFASYPAHDFAARQFPASGKIRAASRSNWAACQRCSGFIEADNWSALLDRSVETFRVKYPILPIEQIRPMIADLHQQFRENRQRMQ